MLLVSALEENVYKNGNCTVEMQPEKNDEVYAIRFLVNDEGVLDVHGFIDTYDREYWVKDENNRTVTNPKARITGSRYFQTFTKKEELLTILASLTSKMIVGEPTCVKTRKETPQANTKKSAELINLVVSSMLNISNKELTEFVTMPQEEIIKFLMGKTIMSRYEYLGSDTLGIKCEDVVDRYNGMIKLQREMDTGLDQNKINEARKIWYKLQEDNTDNSFKVPVERQNHNESDTKLHIVK